MTEYEKRTQAKKQLDLTLKPYCWYCYTTIKWINGGQDIILGVHILLNANAASSALIKELIPIEFMGYTVKKFIIH